MQTLNYEVGLITLQAIPEIVDSLAKCDIDCTVTYSSITKAKLEISPRNGELTMDDVLYLGALIGRIEAMSIRS